MRINTKDGKKLLNAYRAASVKPYLGWILLWAFLLILIAGVT
jgi:hypothetical protein